MPLSLLKTGETVRVVRIGGADRIKKHLGNLGLTVGTVIRVVGDTEGGKIVGVQGTRLALNDDLASRINCAGIYDRVSS